MGNIIWTICKNVMMSEDLTEWMDRYIILYYITLNIIIGTISVCFDTFFSICINENGSLK